MGEGELLANFNIYGAFLLLQSNLTDLSILNLNFAKDSKFNGFFCFEFKKIFNGLFEFEFCERFKICNNFF
jgi:hypothetical protein